MPHRIAPSAPVAYAVSVLLVSNRLPVTVKRSKGKAILTRSTGGLVAGLGPIHDQGDSLWIGNIGGNVPTADLKEKRLVSVPLPKQAAKRHYEGYSNQVLWPLFHYLLEHVQILRADFDAYRLVNETFADTVAEHAEPDATIWVHDYHLMLLPGMLRERLPHATIGFFLHIPFPSSEVFRILPSKEDILRGLLGADLIGLHTYDYARHLVSCFRRVLDVEFDDHWEAIQSHKCKVGVFPLGVDVPTLENRANSPPVQERQNKLQERYGDRKIILGVDRLDYTKGIDLRLKAFAKLLENHPRWQRDAVFVQLAVPSRSNIASYKELRATIEQMVGTLNGMYSRDGLVPIDYMYRSVSPEELAALYRAADVCWVTPIRDGMNLVAKEYVAHHTDDRGVLVLSEFAGAASEMGEALLHNPWDLHASANALHTALTLPEDEVRHSMQALRRRVRAHDVHRWVRRFIEALDDCQHRHHPLDSNSVCSEDDLLAALTPYLRGDARTLIALDYDGTLTPLVSRPEDAVPSQELFATLTSLAARPNMDLAIISGRPRDNLEAWFGDIPLHLSAEHGLHYRLGPDGLWESQIGALDLSWQEAVRTLFEDYTARTPGTFIETKSVTMAWHYRRAELSFGRWQARELMQHLSEAFGNSALEVMHGSRIIEVRPLGFNKGRVLRHFIEELGPFDVVLVVGDDRTDEDMFTACRREDLTVKVGPGSTAATYRLADPQRVCHLLQLL